MNPPVVVLAVGSDAGISRVARFFPQRYYRRWLLPIAHGYTPRYLVVVPPPGSLFDSSVVLIFSMLTTCFGAGLPCGPFYSVHFDQFASVRLHDA